MKALLFFLIIFCQISSADAKSRHSLRSQNKRIGKWIKVFQRNKNSYFNSWIQKSQQKLPKIKALLKRQKLPADLAYLPIIESGLNAKARSSANAVGYWQFMAPTAKQYGLKINWWLDERHDMVKSTWAAAKYLKKLHSMFNGDWFLALSAYNMGENRLKRLIKKYNTRNFWKLSMKPSFPAESRDYVPKFLAAALIVKNPKRYGFKRPNRNPAPKYTYHFVPGGTDLLKIANKLHISKDRLKELNPELKRFFIPKYINSHRIRVPKDFRKKVTLYFSKNIQ